MPLLTPAQLVSSSARADRPCGATAPVQEETGREEHVRDLDRRHLACCSLYPPLASTVARAGGPPSDTPTRLAAARHAPEGPRAAWSCDGCAAPLALSGSGEHARDVLSTPAAWLEVWSSVRAVVTRERRGLIAEWNGSLPRRESMAASKVSLMVALVVALPGQDCVPQDKCCWWSCSHGRPLQAHHTTFLH